MVHKVELLARTADSGARVLVKNQLRAGDAVDVLAPGGPNRSDRIRRIADDAGTVKSMARPGTTVTVTLDTPPDRLNLLRIPVVADDEAAP